MNAIPGSCSPLRPAKPPAATQTGLAPRARPGVPGFSPERTTFRVDRTRNRVLRHAEDPRDLGLRQPILDQPRRQVVVRMARCRRRGQPAGNAMSYGGPHYGFLAARSEFIR